jgi:hypothetical protein
VSEIVTFEQNRFARHLSQGIGEAVSKVQTRAMATFAILAPSYAGNLHLFEIRRNNLEFCIVEEQIKLPTRGFTTSSFQHDSGLENIRR